MKRPKEVEMNDAPKTRQISETMEKCPQLAEDGFDPGKAQTVVCRLYGISRVLENLKNAVTLVHGPKGCANYLQTEALCINRKLGPILSSDTRETDIILGTEDRLREALREAVEIYHPEIITVLTTCATDIIAEDTARVVEEMSDQLGVKVFFKSGGGFIAAYDQGYYDGYEILVSGLMEKPTQRKKDHVNLIGDVRPGGSDRHELVRLIEALGLKFHMNLIAGLTPDEIRKSQEAELNIAKCNPTALRTVQLIEHRFGTPFLAPANPVGIRWTTNWVMELARFFGREEKAKRLVDSEISQLQPTLKWAKRSLGGKKVAIASGPGKLPGLTALAIELGMDVTFCYSHTYTKDTDEFLKQTLEGYSGKPKIMWEYGSGYLLEKALREVDMDLYIGSDVEKGFLYKRGIPVTCIMCYSMPYFGFRGVKKLTEHIERIVNNPIRSLAARVCKEEKARWRGKASNN